MYNFVYFVTIQPDQKLHRFRENVQKFLKKWRFLLEHSNIR